MRVEFHEARDVLHAGEPGYYRVNTANGTDAPGIHVAHGRRGEVLINGLPAEPRSFPGCTLRGPYTAHQIDEALKLYEDCHRENYANLLASVQKGLLTQEQKDADEAVLSALLGVPRDFHGLLARLEHQHTPLGENQLRASLRRLIATRRAETYDSQGTTCYRRLVQPAPDKSLPDCPTSPQDGPVNTVHTIIELQAAFQELYDTAVASILESGTRTAVSIGGLLRERGVQLQRAEVDSALQRLTAAGRVTAKESEGRTYYSLRTHADQP